MKIRPTEEERPQPRPRRKVLDRSGALFVERSKGEPAWGEDFEERQTETPAVHCRKCVLLLCRADVDAELVKLQRPRQDAVLGKFKRLLSKLRVSNINVKIAYVAEGEKRRDGRGAKVAGLKTRVDAEPW